MTDNHKHAGTPATIQSPNCPEEADINESFEKLLLAEEVAEAVGYEEGYEAGSKKILVGYHLGYHRSSHLAARLGYYYGILQYCMNDRLFSEKVIRQAKELQEALDSFPRDNDNSVDVLTKVEDIKIKYKKLCSLTKIDPSYPEDEQLDY